MFWLAFQVGIPTTPDPATVGFRSLKAPWVGGASVPTGGGPTPATVAFRSPLAFWLGGASAPGGGGGGGGTDDTLTRWRRHGRR